MWEVSDWQENVVDRANRGVVIIVACILTILSALIETRTPGGGTHKLFMKVSCCSSCDCFGCIATGDGGDKTRDRDVELGDVKRS